MSLNDFNSDWDALQQNLQGNTGKAFTEDSLKAASAMPVQKLKKRWNWRIIMVLVILPVWPVVMFYFDDTIVRLLTGILLIVNLWSIYITVQLKQKITAIEKADMPVLEYLHLNYNLITKAIKLEERVFIFIYPISVAAGYFAGSAAKTGMDRLFSSPEKLQTGMIVLGICMVVLTPLSHLLSRLINKVLFGSYLKELKGIIDSYETEKQ